jgi:hypothetical protein
MRISRTVPVDSAAFRRSRWPIRIGSWRWLQRWRRGIFGWCQPRYLPNVKEFQSFSVKDWDRAHYPVSKLAAGWLRCAGCVRIEHRKCVTSLILHETVYSDIVFAPCCCDRDAWRLNCLRKSDLCTEGNGPRGKIERIALGVEKEPKTSGIMCALVSAVVTLVKGSSRGMVVGS